MIEYAGSEHNNEMFATERTHFESPYTNSTRRDVTPSGAADQAPVGIIPHADLLYRM
jgi:hypothetical protein